MSYYLKSLFSAMIIGMMLCGVTGEMVAQKRWDNQANLRQKLTTHKIAFLTDRLQLTESEAEKFWPIYRAYEVDKKDLREDMIIEDLNADISEKEAEKALDQMLDIKAKELDMQKKYIDKFKSVLPASKVIRWIKAEKEFKAKMVKKVREKQKQKMK